VSSQPINQSCACAACAEKQHPMRLHCVEGKIKLCTMGKSSVVPQVSFKWFEKLLMAFRCWKRKMASTNNDGSIVVLMPNLKHGLLTQR